ncbi:MAG: hypothetical protein QNJ15_00945 [Erythrobacter sp.]|nr:hypothetical protein [Erythrobacter sp.]
MVKQAELEALVLHGLYEYYQRASESLTLEDVQEFLSPDVTDARVELALGVLGGNGWVNIARPIVSGQRTKYSLTDAGYKYAEQLNERAEHESDPLAKVESQLAPGADRVVSFSDNQRMQEDAIAAVEDAEEVLRSSNQIDPAVRDEAILGSRSWKDGVTKGRAFAVASFKFLVWDRLKAIAEGGIEDAYRVALTGILLTLGTIIVSLF